MPHLFIIPDPTTFPSGGNHYNLSLIRALQQMELPVQHQALEHLYEIPPDHTLWVDSLYLKDWTEQIAAPPANLIVHHLEGMYPEGPQFEVEAERDMLGKFDHFLCTSHWTVEYLNKQGISSDRCVVVEPACDMPVTDTRELPAQFSALMVANLVPRKGILPFLEALAHQMLEGDSFHLSIVGTGSLDPDYAQACRDFVEKHNELTDSVHFSGEAGASEMPGLYSQHHLLVSAAGLESYGMAIREAQTMGLPVLALDGGNTRFHLGGQQQGILCTRMDDLAAEFLQLARHPEAVEKLARRQWEVRPEPVSWEAQATLFHKSSLQWQVNNPG